MSDVEKVLKHVPEDVVEYKVFPIIPSNIEEDDALVLEFLQKFANSIFACFSDRLVNYIWQHECFHLRPVITPNTPNDSLPPHLHGSTSFGDNIDDEWFIVSLLYDVTREFAGCVVRVIDNDEEFLLIEAADALPKWLNPETAENRVYIYNGDLHVIPIPESPDDFSKFPMFTPTHLEAIACVRDCTRLTRCSQPIQDLINKRLTRFPQKTRENVHSVNCLLPTPLAVLLDTYPSLVSAAVRRFYYRDPLELKACRPMRRFKPDDLVRTRVRMTRCLYAQLVQQQFSPDRRSGWPCVAASNPDFLEHDIGIKLAHGFEILCSKCKDDNLPSNEENLNHSNIQWQQFKQSLANKGYFRREVEGSKLYLKLLNDAKQFYLSQLAQNEDQVVDVGQEVLLRLKTLEPKFEAFRSAVRSLPPSDDDSWINVTPEQIDEMLSAAGGIATQQRGQEFDLSKISQSMSSFVEHESGLEGAEFPKPAAENGDADAQIAGSGMIEAMQKLFDFPDEKDSTGSDMSEYDWSEDSDDELGTLSKMNPRRKKSSLRQPDKMKEQTNGQTDHAKSKSVRFSGPDLPGFSVVTSNQTSGPPASTESPKSCPTAESESLERILPKAPVVPPRPSKLVTSPAPTAPPRPRKTPPPPPPRPASNPPSIPTRPARPARISGVVKPKTPPPPPPPSKGSVGKRDKKLEALMDAMDRELSATDVGKSFEREPVKNNPRRPGRPSAARDIDDEDDDFRPVNVDLTVVKNTLESYKAQQGLPGPASNILAGFGLKLPDDEPNAKA